MLDILFSVGTVIFWLVVILYLRRVLFNSFAEPNERAKKFILENSFILHPNMISFYGVVLVLYAVVSYAIGFYWLAIFLYVGGSFLDAVDGMVARAAGLETEMGKSLDPFFDKLKTLPLIMFFAYEGCFPVYLAAAYICLDILGQLARPVIHFLNKRGHLKMSVASNGFGKFKTVFAHFLIIYSDLQLRVHFVPDAASYFLWITFVLGVLSIVFKFSKKISFLGQMQSKLPRVLSS